MIRCLGEMTSGLLALFCVAGMAWASEESTQYRATIADWHVRSFDPTVEKRVEELLGKLTLEQKIRLISGGEEEFETLAAPEISLPILKMANGPMGVGTYGKSTAYAGGAALAASWDPDLARQVGESIGNDALARGVHILLGPGVNIYRTPFNARNYEYYGEDPYLAAQTVVGFIEGVQSKGVVATVKHFAGYNSTLDDASSDIDERTLRELYLPAFEAAVERAHVGAVMSAYNRLNGVDCSENFELNWRILKGDWGFDGILMSDWGATHHGIASANAGLDLEMPGGNLMTDKILLPAIRMKEVSPATIDDKVRRILRVAIRFGFLDHPQQPSDIPLNNEHSRAVSLESSREGIVLLKNRDHLLPLHPQRIHTLAVFGPAATSSYQRGSRSTQIETFGTKTNLEGITQFLGDRVKVLYVPSPVVSVRDLIAKTIFDSKGRHPTFTIETFDNPQLKGAPLWSSHARPDQGLKDYFQESSTHHPRGLRIVGRFTPKASGLYVPVISSDSADGYTLYVDGHEVLNQPVREGQPPGSQTIRLTAGRAVELQLDYRLDTPYADTSYSLALESGLGLASLDDIVPETLRQAATQADAAIVLAGFTIGSQSDGFERNFRLPWGQDQLIDAVASANPRTIVSIMSGGGVDMSAWVDKAAGILETWFPGQEGGTALAEILFGARSPEGHLPMTFDRSAAENPAARYYKPVAAGPMEPARTTYGEGLFLGYRYYTSQQKHPLFPFGFGLSYTTFSFSKLALPSSVSAEAGMDVSFNVTNTGDRPGAEVAQLYVGDPSAKSIRPARELKAFQKVRLAAKESKQVTLHLDRRAFAYWDPSIRDWRVDPGEFVIYVGNSSEDSALVGKVTIH
jgi:beta-glucosidase